MKKKQYKGALLVLSFLLLLWAVRISFVTVIVRGTSMEPTLLDRATGMAETIFYRVFGISRFSIVVFYQDSPDHPGEEESWIKRVIGLPGETIFYQENQLYINGIPVAEPFLTDEAKASTCAIALVPDGLGGVRPKLPQMCVTPVVLGAQEYFVMGDHRENSYDSRYLDSPLEGAQIIARGLVLYGRCQNEDETVCSEFQWTWPRLIGW